MSDLRQAAQAALSALELAQTDVHWELNSPTRRVLRKAELALRAALEAQQEPVAERIIYDLHGLHDTELIRENDSGDALIRLDDAIAVVEEHLAAPPARKPLPQVDVIAGFCETPHENQYVAVFEAGVRFAERAHGIGGGDE